MAFEQCRTDALQRRQSRGQRAAIVMQAALSFPSSRAPAQSAATRGRELRETPAARRGMRARLVQAALQQWREPPALREAARAGSPADSDAAPAEQRGRDPVAGENLLPALPRGHLRGAFLMAAILQWRATMRSAPPACKKAPRPSSDSSGHGAPANEAPSRPREANEHEDGGAVPAGLGLTISAAEAMLGAKRQGWGEVHSGIMASARESGGRWVRSYLVLDEDNCLHAFLSPHSLESLIVLPLLLMAITEEQIVRNTSSEPHRTMSIRMASQFESGDGASADAADAGELQSQGRDNVLAALASPQETRDNQGAGQAPVPHTGHEEDEGNEDIEIHNDVDLVLLPSMAPAALDKELARGLELCLRVADAQDHEEWCACLSAAIREEHHAWHSS